MAFKLLPLEINERIASNLDTDSEVCNFGLICRETYTALNSYRCGIWRTCFARQYDLPADKRGIELKMEYWIRRRYLQRTTKFDMGQESHEIICMYKLRDLILESFADVKVGVKATRPSNNIAELRRFVQRSNILDKVQSCLHRTVNFNPLLQTLQLILMHWQLDLSLHSPVCGFPYSQQAVYAHPDDFPIFLDENYRKVNIEFLSHTANFFKYHIRNPQEQTLYHLFEQLEDHEKPRPWEARLFQGPGVKKLGKKWKGSYAYLHDTDDMPLIRSYEPGSGLYFTDSIDSEDGFQTLELDFPSAIYKPSWPKVFETHLHALPPVSLCRELRKDSDPKPRPGQGSIRHRHRNITPLQPLLVPTPSLETPPPTPGTVPFDISYPAPVFDIPRSPPPTPRLMKPEHGRDYLQFSGSGTDAEEFHCNGIVHAIPRQHDIPGWHRVSMMKYFDPLSTPSSQSSSASSTSDGTFGPISPPSSNTSSSSSSGSDNSQSHHHGIGVPAYHHSGGDDLFANDEVDINAGCWAYEGVVLPGGMIILGRWWSPMDQDRERRCMGPFIFWNIEDRD